MLRKIELRKDYIPTLDGWRSVAIVLVLLAHAVPSFAQNEPIKATTLIGVTGVRVFFGLSGFLITNLLLAEERGSGEINLKSFYLRRFFRIIPAAAAFLFAAAILSAIGAIDITTRRWIDTLFFFANYSNAPHSYYVGHFWSLAVEEHFYFVWPCLLIVLVTLRKRALTAIAICFAVGTWRAIAFKYQITMEDTAKFWGRTDINVDAILWGAIVAMLVTKTEVRFLLLSAWARLLAPIAYAAVVLGTFLYSGWKLWLLFNELTFIMMPILLFQTSQLDARSLILRFLEWEPVRWVGRLSYSLYLWQQLFLTPKQLLLVQIFPFNLACAFFCAIACHYVIERPSRVFRLRAAEAAVRPLL